jgi:hypothetical protein
LGASFFGLDDSEEVRLNKHAVDVDTAETLVGARLIRQAAVQAWAAADRAVAESPEQLFALCVELAAEEARHMVRDGTDVDGSVPDGDGPAGLLSPGELLLRRLAPIGVSDAFHDLRATAVDLVGEAKPVSAGGGRTVAELLDDSDGLAREALLDMFAGWVPGMVRGWRHLMQSAAELWAVLPPARTVSADGGPIAILAAMGRAVGRGLAAGHWPGWGPRDEAWEQIASNLMQGRRLLHEQPVASEAVSTDSPTTAITQILHALSVAPHATLVALTGYQRDVQPRLDVSARRRQPLVERPTVLESCRRGAHDRPVDTIEQLAAGFMAARRLNAGDQPAAGCPRRPRAWEPHWASGKSRPTGHSPGQTRAVHDALGRGSIGLGFDRHGEEAAWVKHSQMYSALARPALTTKTRGQTCAFFYGNYGKFFPPPRATLFPAKFWSP